MWCLVKRRLVVDFNQLKQLNNIEIRFALDCI